MSYHYKKNLGLPAGSLAGFSLPELLVTIGIVTVILAIVLSNQSTYTDRAALTNLADEIGLNIAQAQAYGVATKEFSPGLGEFSASYGLAFSLRTSPPAPANSGSPTAYLYFADRIPLNKYYNGDWTCPVVDTSECLQKTTISGGNEIVSLCMVMTASSDDCSVGRIDISFNRPNTEAQLMFFNSSGDSMTNINMKGAKITLRSVSGLTKSVIVYKTGQISIQ